MKQSSSEEKAISEISKSQERERERERANLVRCYRELRKDGCLARKKMGERENVKAMNELGLFERWINSSLGTRVDCLNFGESEIGRALFRNRRVS